MEELLFSVLRQRGPEFVGKVKGASFATRHQLLVKQSSAAGDVAKGAARWAREFASQHKPEIIGGLSGAALSALISGVTGTRFKGKPSYMESRAKEMRAEIASKKAELKASGKAPGFKHKLDDLYSKAYQDLAKAVAEHPAAGAALFSITGGALGTGLGREVADTIAGWRK